MSCETKQEYLYELSRELRGYFKKQEVKNIVDDYSEFFDAGVSDGKSEAQICEEFGNVQNLARDIADNQVDVKPKILRKKYILTGFAAVSAIFLYFFADIITINSARGGIEVGQQIMLLFAPLLILLAVKLYKKYEIQIDERILFFVLCVPVIIGFILFANFTYRFIPMFLAKTAVNLIIVIFILLTLRKEREDIKYANFLAMLYILTGMFQILNNIMASANRVLMRLVYWDRIDRYWLARSLVNDIEMDTIILLFTLIAAAMLYTYSFWRRYCRYATSVRSKLPKIKIPKYKLMKVQEEGDE